jgi:heterodisulfide reductase subunit B
MIISQRNPGLELPSILYPQLLGLSLGIDEDLLGLKEKDLPSVADSAA